MERREFLVKSVVGFGAVAFGPGMALATEKKLVPVYYDPSRQDVPLGRTGMKMSRMCLGTGMNGGKRQSNQTRLGREKFEALIRHAYERGVRVFDLADLYGTHPYIVRALKKIPRKNYKIISKIWFRPRGIPEKERLPAETLAQRFLKEMNTDYIDLLLLHCVISPKWNSELDGYMNDLAKLKKKGIIRAHGLSCHSLDALKTVAVEPWVDSVHVRINPYGAKMDGKLEDVAPVVEKIHRAGKGVIGMKLIGAGTFRDDGDKRSKSLQYVLGLGAVDVLNVGCENPAEIDDLIKRIAKIPRSIRKA